MSAGMPELGSKISLISKADIRYEGRLFTVDPTECTIALAAVRSYGTEDRETSYPILPQQTIYDYILFRGSDIKDIRVVNSVAIPNDPAIMQMHLPPQQSFPPSNQFPIQQGSPMAQFGQFGSMQGGNVPGPTLGQVAAAMKQNQQAQVPQSQSPIQQPGKPSKKNLAPGSGQKNKKSSELSNGIDVMSSSTTKQQPRKQSNKSQDSRSGTPNLSRKSPSSDRGNHGNQNQRDHQAGKENIQRQGQRNNQRNNNQQQQPRERRDSGRNEVQENKGGYRQNQNPRPNHQMNNNHQQQPPLHHQQQQQRGYNNNNRNNYNGGQQNNQMRGNNQGGSARMRGPPPMHLNNYRQQSNQGTPNQNQNKPQNGPQQQRKSLKFENEFDFDEANSKFEELRATLATLTLKVRPTTEETQPTEQVNGEVEKKDDSGNETSADPEDNGYDKNKSFFDNISCEAVERSKGKTQRTNWREERKINSETFGYAFNRRGNFRGRGGYYNSYNRGPRPGGYRSGNPNYRPVRNHRNQNTVEGRPNPQASNGQQSQTMAAAVAAN